MVSPTLSLNYQNEFHFAENTDSSGCFCCWKSKTVKKDPPEGFYIKKDGTLAPFKASKSHDEEIQARIRANSRLARLVSSKFSDDAIENNIAFGKLREKVNHNFEYDAHITEEKLIAIVDSIYEIKREVTGKGTPPRIPRSADHDIVPVEMDVIEGGYYDPNAPPALPARDHQKKDNGGICSIM